MRPGSLTPVPVIQVSPQRPRATRPRSRTTTTRTPTSQIEEIIRDADDALAASSAMVTRHHNDVSRSQSPEALQAQHQTQYQQLTQQPTTPPSSSSASRPRSSTAVAGVRHQPLIVRRSPSPPSSAQLSTALAAVAEREQQLAKEESERRAREAAAKLIYTSREQSLVDRERAIAKREELLRLKSEARHAPLDGLLRKLQKQTDVDLTANSGLEFQLKRRSQDLDVLQRSCEHRERLLEERESAVKKQQHDLSAWQRRLESEANRVEQRIEDMKALEKGFLSCDDSLNLSTGPTSASSSSLARRELELQLLSLRLQKQEEELQQREKQAIRDTDTSRNDERSRCVVLPWSEAPEDADYYDHERTVAMDHTNEALRKLGEELVLCRQQLSDKDDIIAELKAVVRSVENASEHAKGSQDVLREELLRVSSALESSREEVMSLQRDKYNLVERLNDAEKQLEAQSQHQQGQQQRLVILERMMEEGTSEEQQVLAAREAALGRREALLKQRESVLLSKQEEFVASRSGKQLSETLERLSVNCSVTPRRSLQ